MNVSPETGRGGLDWRSRFCHQEVLAEGVRGWRGRAKAGEGQELRHISVWGT